MNIYRCWHDSFGFGVSSVVQAKTKKDAAALLGLDGNEETADVSIIEIGIAHSSIERIWCEETT